MHSYILTRGYQEHKHFTTGSNGSILGYVLSSTCVCYSLSNTMVIASNASVKDNVNKEIDMVGPKHLSIRFEDVKENFCLLVC